MSRLAAVGENGFDKVLPILRVRGLAGVMHYYYKIKTYSHCLCIL